MPIELCAALTPHILIFSEIEDSQVKLNAYLTLEVLFASRRFSNTDQVATRTLTHLLDNSEVIQSVVSYEAGEGDQASTQLKVDKKDEMKVIAYI